MDSDTYYILYYNSDCSAVFNIIETIISNDNISERILYSANDYRSSMWNFDDWLEDMAELNLRDKSENIRFLTESELMLELI